MMTTGVTVARQILEINKTLARNGFRTLTLLQERSDRVAQSFLAPNGETSVDTGRLWEGWSEAGLAGREAFEAALDAYFEMLAGMLPISDRRF
jgi:hypothetical protein